MMKEDVIFHSSVASRIQFCLCHLYSNSTVIIINNIIVKY